MDSSWDRRALPGFLSHLTNLQMHGEDTAVGSLGGLLVSKATCQVLDQKGLEGTAPHPPMFKS